MKSFLALLLVLIIAPSTFAKLEYVRLSPGKVIAYEWLQKNPNSPTLMLLPGVNRALGSDDRGVQLLLAQGWNVLTPSLINHPQSIAGLNRYEIPFFITRPQIRSQDLAGDLEALVEKLDIKNVIPVSLSYSSSLGAFLNPEKFPFIIDTVPLIIASESNPEAAAKAKQMEDLAMLNPFLGPFWIRSFRDQAYYQHWSTRVDNMLKEDSEAYGENPRTSDIKMGYVSIARAVEDFDFRSISFSENSQTRDFVFAGQELPGRLVNQIQVLRSYLKTGKPTRVVVVQKAGHVLPSDMPGVYAETLRLLASTPQKGVQFLVINSPSDLGQFEWADQQALERWMNSISQ